MKCSPLITGEFETFARGRGDDLYLIREYMPEDSARHVDWKATAKSGSLKVREFSREDERKLRLVFDNPGSGNGFRAGLRKCGDGGGIVGLALRREQCRTVFCGAGLQGRGRHS